MLPKRALIVSGRHFVYIKSPETPGSLFCCLDCVVSPGCSDRTGSNCNLAEACSITTLLILVSNSQPAMVDRYLFLGLVFDLFSSESSRRTEAGRSPIFQRRVCSKA